MCVDVWHFQNKHKTMHTFCQEHCNPADFLKLKSEDGKGWWFTTSIAEQVNLWLGGYHLIICEMMQVKYNFFFDEMIWLCNLNTLEPLKAKGL
ncbi:hypothetical protein CONPUDRAFT_58890 [Coniophora puteana RWD-64-598 SS2]|uniref:CxC2-like cysteine cluster KDZ transposase-associated domain-containing protein n=1 Tax=Coniophora puteana (strain RWD-64-598) TaxID=741705 RepID=A0A5M3MLK5_CONPW|nr:uncharacterized protein CONPUDRAFT_58890 [Coniophora puteana RWD-64-598 SS2]EIW80109.1 hypothetical protein CONPUDRAFT_58890 [Coniophora puteana RWD-64-598 SS2]